MNSVSTALIPKVYSAGPSSNAMTQAALIAAGLISGDYSDPGVQAALTDVLRDATSSENPAMWVAAFLADMAVNGVPGGGGISVTPPASVGAGNIVISAANDYIGGGVSKLDGEVTTSVDVPAVYFFKHATLGWKQYLLRAGTDAEASPNIIRPDDYAASTNEKIFELMS